MSAAELVVRARDVQVCVVAGPWEWDVDYNSLYAGHAAEVTIITSSDEPVPMWEANFIATARTLVPALADALETLTAENAALQARIDAAVALIQSWHYKGEFVVAAALSGHGPSLASCVPCTAALAPSQTGETA